MWPAASMERKTVLCIFEERKRPVVYDASTDEHDEKNNLMKAIMTTFSDVLQETESTSRSYFLQQESEEWGGLIEVCNKLDDHATVYLCYSSTGAEVSILSPPLN